jgi:hypothetical protein
MKSRIALIAAAGTVAAVAVTVLLLGTSATGSTPGGEMTQISNDGQPMDASPSQRHELENVGAISASRLATRDGRTFYRLLRSDGSVCYAVNSTSDPDRIGSTTCPAVPGSFPSSHLPVLDLTVFESTSHVLGDTHVVASQGFAADGVTTVALLDQNGKAVARARASDNVYTVDVPQGRVATTVVAYDRKKAEVFRVP